MWMLGCKPVFDSIFKCDVRFKIVGARNPKMFCSLSFCDVLFDIVINMFHALSQNSYNTERGQLPFRH
jgi:hypothetical protein